jgi:hypothetical protein
VLDGGETSGEDRLPFLDTGVLDILAEATGGLSIVLEHRYYGTSRVSLYIRVLEGIHFISGTSIPVANFSTDSMRQVTYSIL